MVKISADWKGLKGWERAEKTWQKDTITQTFAEIERAAFKIERDAKLLAPVDTGDLRRSIETDVKKNSASIQTETGTDIEYSEVVEFGGINQRAQPYLIPSYDQNIKKLERTITNILRG